MARRVKVLQPDTPLLQVRRVKGIAAEDKVASGMEVAYSVTYTPENADQFHYDLVICTEREKFLVPCTVAGSKAALDFPDQLEFPMTPAKCSSSQTCLVTNVGGIVANFMLTAYPPFQAEPARAQLPPGETMQCSILYTPQSTGMCEKHYGGSFQLLPCCCLALRCSSGHTDGKTLLLAGTHTSDLEIQYEQGDLVYASLVGQCSEVNVQLSQEVVSLQPTYIDTQSQRSFR